MHTHIAPLAAVFIIAHDLADFALASDGKDVDIMKFMRTVVDMYTSSQFRKVLAALQDITF